MRDSETVTLSQICEALTVMGIEPDVTHVREIRIDPRGVTITRYQHDDGGSHLLAPDNPHAIRAEISTIRVTYR